MLTSYQNLPQQIDSVAFSVGPFDVQWYALMWLAAFATVYCLLVWRVNRGEGAALTACASVAKQKNTQKKQSASPEITTLQDLLLNAFFGALIGGRLGYVLFYDFAFFVANPLAIISPYDVASGTWTGIFGMSYHGGIIGVAVALWWTVRGYRRRGAAAPCSLRRVADFVVPAVPLGYVFGRVGNFLNGELFGRVTEVPWGMYFVDGSIGLLSNQMLRHPSQLYEALGEGLLLFIILWFLRNRAQFPGQLLLFYVGGYAIVRFFLEFFREPDAHIGFIIGAVSLGQLLSLGMLVVAGWFYVRWNSTREYTNGK